MGDGTGLQIRRVGGGGGNRDKFGIIFHVTSYKHMM